jgi:hypothetical protein
MKEMKNENNQNEDRGKLTIESEQTNRSSIRLVLRWMIHITGRPFIIPLEYTIEWIVHLFL